ncbi:MAG: hypothetical protein K2Y21_07730 [Phycisphaerales bacterium]|nr:hypothetical protein [Phycisphaerales bacterium]
MPTPAPTPDSRTPAEKAKARAEFLNRLAFYLGGVAIGFLLLGFFKARGRAEAQRREAERAAMIAPAESTPSPATTSGSNTPATGIQPAIPNEKR